jgi:hypothetical protein
MARWAEMYHCRGGGTRKKKQEILVRKRREHFGDVGVEMRIVLKWALRKVWTGGRVQCRR